MNCNYRKEFMTWWESFQEMDHSLITSMINTVEDSPHHREDNVYFHTKLVVNQYIKLVDEKVMPWSYEDLQGAVACVFHDFGKPDSEIEEYSEKYGAIIRRYSGHEVISAGHFMNCWTNDTFNVRSIIDDVHAFYNVWVMIAYHLPYQLGDSNEKILKTHLTYYGIYDTFQNVLYADTLGRIQDNRQESIERCTTWLYHFDEDVNPVYLRDSDSKTYVMVGVPASGKTTYVEQLNGVVTSYDATRRKLFPELDTYREVFNACDQYFNDEERDVGRVYDKLGIGKKDKQYGSNEVLQMEMRDTFKKTPLDIPVIIDNTSLSMKYRRIINSMDEARERHAYVFVRSLDELIDNEHNRPYNEKRGVDVIKNMYYRYFPVLIGEVDDITIIPPKNYRRL